MKKERKHAKENYVESKVVKDEESKIVQEDDNLLKKLVQADEPELTQEEEIMNFKEDKKKKLSQEEEERLEWVKKELLASLERVKDIVKRFYPSQFQKVVKIDEKLRQQMEKEKDVEEQDIEKVDNKEIDENNPSKQKDENGGNERV